jgi:hypothetical protein
MAPSARKGRSPSLKEEIKRMQVRLPAPPGAQCPPSVKKCLFGGPDGIIARLKRECEEHMHDFLRRRCQVRVRQEGDTNGK